MITGKHPKRHLLENSNMSNTPSPSRHGCGHLPGVLVTSLNSSKSKSKVGGWCCRGQLDTAAVSCSNRMIQTSIRPGKQKADLSETQISITKNRHKSQVNTVYEWQRTLGLIVTAQGVSPQYLWAGKDWLIWSNKVKENTSQILP